jgi:hypothetical protein
MSSRPRRRRTRAPEGLAGHSVGRVLGRTGLLAGVLLGVAGCSPPASFDLRWRIAPFGTDPADAEALTSVRDCAASGIDRLVVETYLLDPDGDPIFADTATFSCFPQGFTDADARVEGPALERSGRVRGVVYGLSRTKTRWDPDFAFAQFEVDVDADATAHPDELILLAPPECQNSIDDDRDGLVDGADPACAVEGAFERDDTGASQFDVRVTFLGENPAFSCSGAGVGTFRTQLRDPQDAVVYTSQSGCEAQFPLRIPQFSLDLDAGEYELQVDVLSPSGAALTTPWIEPVMIIGASGTSIERVHDFGAGDFVPALEAPISFILGYSQEDGLIRTSCSPPPSQPSLLSFDEVRFVIRDEQGNPVDTSGFDATPLGQDGDFTRIVCPNKIVGGPDFTWGAFTFEGVASAAGIDCFSTTEPLRLAPHGGGDPQSLSLSRILEDGAPPAGCEECLVNSDCGPLRECDTGICVDP